VTNFVLGDINQENLQIENVDLNEQLRIIGSQQRVNYPKFLRIKILKTFMSLGIKMRDIHQVSLNLTSKQIDFILEEHIKEVYDKFKIYVPLKQEN